MNSRKVANLLAYVAVGLIALSVIVNYLTVKVFHLTSEISTWCNLISYYLACFVTIVSAFSYAKAKRSTAYMAFLIIFVIVIIVFTFVI